jgi:hypothetical protein
VGGHILSWSFYTLIQALTKIRCSEIQLLSTATYLPLAKVGRLYYIDRYSRFLIFLSLPAQNPAEQKPLSALGTLSSRKFSYPNSRNKKTFVSIRSQNCQCVIDITQNCQWFCDVKQIVNVSAMWHNVAQYFQCVGNVGNVGNVPRCVIFLAGPCSVQSHLFSEKNSRYST